MPEWSSRGYFPHRDRLGLKQHVCIHLADSMPQKALKRLRHELMVMKRELEVSHGPEEVEAILTREKRIRLHGYLDAGYGECHLRIREIAEMSVDVLRRNHDDEYTLFAWCVMPNHIHALFRPEKRLMRKIVGRWKNIIGHKANKILGREGQFWHREFFDRFIRDGKHHRSALDYIENNPVEAGLINDKRQWPHSSASNRHVA